MNNTNIKLDFDSRQRAAKMAGDFVEDPENAAFVMVYLEDTLWRIAQGVESPSILAKEALSSIGRDFDAEQAAGNAK